MKGESRTILLGIITALTWSLMALKRVLYWSLPLSTRAR
jgi:hypothetical protein